MKAILKSKAKEVILKYPLRVAAVALILSTIALLLLFLWLFRNPANYEDCIWAAAKSPTKEGALVAMRYCNKKFRDEAKALEQPEQSYYVPYNGQLDRK